ncbi:MAG: sensor histidine kinase [Sulfurovum sp.]|nr:sensor histidine kinase [Sulfurovum sp.]
MQRPHFKEYIMARLVTMAVGIFTLFALVFALFLESTVTLWFCIGTMALAFSLFTFAIYRGADRMQKELNLVNTYLSHIETADEIHYKAQFFTQEFEDINQNLSKALKASKKREDVKQRYNTKLKLKNRQRADMISAIAHEFRNPIASIMGYAQTLEEDKEIPQSLQEKFLTKIYNNGSKIEALLSRLVLWNKFESGEATLHPTHFDLSTLAEEVKVSLKEKYPNREITIVGEETPIEADRTLLDIVLKNLIENALKYSKEEVTVRIESNKISVSDKGEGISEEDIGKVTKKFYRSGTHTWDNSMGLGLSIVKSILALHHTSLEIESEEEVGSTFSFTIK